MKIAVAQNILRQAISVVRDAVPNSADMPILSNVLIRTTGDDKAELIGTDLDITISTEFVCQVTEPGEITVNAKFLSSAVSALTAGIIEFSTNGLAKATLIGGDTRYKMAVLDAKEFPRAKEVQGESYELPQKALRDMLRKTSYAMLTNNSRRNINGVSLSGNGSTIVAKGTDGRRLSIAETKLEAEHKEFAVLIPEKAVRFLQKLLAAEDGNVKITADGHAIRVNAPAFVFQSRLVDEAFPDISRVIPESSSSEIQVDREQFLTALRQTALSCSGDVLKMVLSIRTGEIVCSASEEASDSRASFPVKYEGEELKISINPNLLADVLNSLDSDEVTLGVTNGNTPVVIKDDGFVGAVMPLRIN